ncbi:MAG: hypothetical protein ACK5HL_01405 [Bacilli bacterium]
MIENFNNLNPGLDEILSNLKNKETYLDNELESKARSYSKVLSIIEIYRKDINNLDEKIKNVKENLECLNYQINYNIEENYFDEEYPKLNENIKRDIKVNEKNYNYYEYLKKLNLNYIIKKEAELNILSNQMGEIKQKLK